MNKSINYFIKVIICFNILFISLGFQRIIAQEKTFILKGRVTNGERKSIPSVSIFINNNPTSNITDINGYFQIVVSKDQSINFSSVGYISKQIRISNAKMLEIILDEDSKSLSDVVIIGYGKVQTLTVKVYQFLTEANIFYAALNCCLLILPPVLLLWMNKRIILRYPN